MTRSSLRCSIAAWLCLPALAGGQTAAAKLPSANQTSANQVVVDVVVTDTHHNVVHNLTKGDFTVLENGHAQTVDTFEEHHAWEAAAPLPQEPKLPRGTFTNYTNAPANGALDILLLDLLNTPAAARGSIRNEMLAYLKQVHPGTRIAILGFSNRLVLLQGFTSDPELLSTALAEKEDATKSAAAMNEPVRGEKPAADEPMLTATQKDLGNDPGVAQVLTGIQQFEIEIPPQSYELRVRSTLNALNQIGRSLSGLPGRKNLIWVSGAFPFNIQPNGDRAHPFAAVGSSENEFRETADLLSRSQVSVYPVDESTRGASTHEATEGAQAESDSNPDAKYIRDPVGYGQDSTSVNEQKTDEPDAMQTMADATGGEAFANTSGLRNTIDEAIERGSSYYTLAYLSTEQSWDGSYRKIRVEVARPGLTLAYRRGYFADEPIAILHQDAAPASADEPASDPALDAAMTPGGPDPTQIIFTASITPTAAGPEPDLAPDNKAVDQAKGPYRRYAVQLGIEARDVNCPTAQEGVHQCTLGLSAIVYDAAGTALVSVRGTIQANIPADQYSSILQSGLGFRQDISVPVGSDCFLRIGIRDQTRDKVGALEIPISAVSNPPPVAAQMQSGEQPVAQSSGSDQR
jgi:VWFA-related protein